MVDYAVNKQAPYRICLALTLYLREAPSALDIQDAWRIYRAVCPPEQLGWVKTTSMNFWREHEFLQSDQALDPYLIEQDQRLDHGVMIRSSETEDRWSFLMRGIFPKDVSAERCASICHVVFPIGTSWKVLLDTAVRLADSLEFLSGHGGYSTQYDPWRKNMAFDEIYPLARRYYGLDVQDITGTVPFVLACIKGADWLTLVGDELLATLQAPGLLGAKLSGSVEVIQCRHGIVVRAGNEATLGDRNRGEFPVDYARVEAELWELKGKQHQEFPGKFRELGATRSWFRRLHEPEGW